MLTTTKRHLLSISFCWEALSIPDVKASTRSARSVVLYSGHQTMKSPPSLENYSPGVHYSRLLWHNTRRLGIVRDTKTRKINKSTGYLVGGGVRFILPRHLDPLCHFQFRTIPTLKIYKRRGWKKKKKEGKKRFSFDLSWRVNRAQVRSESGWSDFWLILFFRYRFSHLGCVCAILLKSSWVRFMGVVNILYLGMVARMRYIKDGSIDHF